MKHNIISNNVLFKGLFLFYKQFNLYLIQNRIIDRLIKREFWLKTYLSDKSSDITIIIDGQTLPSHKFVLSAKSRVFKAMLFGDFKKSNDKQIELKDNQCIQTIA